MEYIVINEIPYKKVEYANPYLINASNYNSLSNCNGLSNRRGSVICILIILIIIVIIIICYLFYSTSGSSNQNNFKNRFQASPKAQKDYETLNKLLQKNPNPTYSQTKTVMGDHIDIAKFDHIIKHKNNLTPSMLDRI